MALANDEKLICFDVETANKLSAELDYCEKLKEYDGDVNSLIKLNEANLITLSEKYKEKVELLAQDKLLERQRGDEFEKVYNTCKDELNSCVKSKPSKLVWFGSGAVTTLVLTVLAFIAL